MTTLFQAVTANNPTALTTNGCLAHESTMNTCLDLFGVIGSARNMDRNDLFAMFELAMSDNPELAIRILLHARDCRGGSGERKTVTDLITWMHSRKEYKPYVKPVLAKLPELGYWKDLLNLYEVKGMAYLINPMFAKALRAQDGLCAKYLPRKGKVARSIRRYMKLREDQWRKMLVALSSTVETKMCANQWHDINYSHVPSRAQMMYRKAFRKHDESRYADFIDCANKGEVKIHAGQLNPVEILSKVRWQHDNTMEAQWKNLPDYIKGAKGILPIIDTSGSMGCSVSGASYSVLDVAVSLGMYTAERASGAFKDQFITFSTRPQMVQIRGNTLHEKYRNIVKANWSMSTNLQAVFELVLNSAVQYNVPESEMPGTLLIVSDMQFNSCVTAGSSVTALDMIRSKYAAVGYTLPKVVFWQANGVNSNSPVTTLDNGTCLISGFNPSIIEAVLGSKDFSPAVVMLEAVMKDRYNF